MRAPLSWLAEDAALGTPLPDADDVARRLTAAGLEVETFEQVGHDIIGVVVAEVTAIEELTGFRKPVRYCQVTAGSGESTTSGCRSAASWRIPSATRRVGRE